MGYLNDVATCARCCTRIAANEPRTVIPTSGQQYHTGCWMQLQVQPRKLVTA